MNIPAVVAGIVYGALSATPALAAGVLLCDPYHCRSSPYLPPPIIPVGPPVVYLPAPYPPLGPDYPPPPRYPLAPPQPPGLRPGYAPPYPPLGNPPQPAPTARALPPPPQPDPPRMSQDQEREHIIQQGEAFCRKYKSDPICHPIKDR